MPRERVARGERNFEMRDDLPVRQCSLANAGQADRVCRACFEGHDKKASQQGCNADSLYNEFLPGRLQQTRYRAVTTNQAIKSSSSRVW